MGSATRVEPVISYQLEPLNRVSTYKPRTNHGSTVDGTLRGKHSLIGARPSIGAQTEAACVLLTVSPLFLVRCVKTLVARRSAKYVSYVCTDLFGRTLGTTINDVSGRMCTSASANLLHFTHWTRVLLYSVCVC